MMLRLKSCPRCKGDIVVERDHYGWYEQCFYCGYIRDLGSKGKINEPTNEMEEVGQVKKGEAP